ncbi:MAG: TrkA family potassium uptake protein [Ruminococcaceae bacterium]|nr:TrkA family potassium uptake protein [Oscillospiraceae bacterium]
MSIKKKREKKLYGVIGLGRFGFALAESIAKTGEDVLAIDKDQGKVTSAAEFTDNAYRVGELTRESLEAVGIANCDVVIVAIGDKLDTSLLTTMNVLKLGVERVISKAQTADQGALLELMGAEVVYPEHDMAVRLARKLTAPNILEYISLSDEIDIVEIKLTKKTEGKTVLELNVRGAFGLNIIAVKHKDKITTDISPKTVFSADDTITVIGKKESIRRFREYVGV